VHIEMQIGEELVTLVGCGDFDAQLVKESGKNWHFRDADDEAHN